MEEQKYGDGQAVEISLEDIVRDENQPRGHFDPEAIAALAQSIRNEGLVQNIVVRPVEGGKFKIVAGERRYRAYLELSKEDGEKWGRIPAVVREIDEQTALNLALLENIHREDLLPIERTEALLEYKERNGIKKDKDLADRIGMSAPNVSNILKLDRLDPQIKDEVRTSKDYSLRELIKVASKRKAEDQIELFNALKSRIEKSKRKGADGKAKPTEEEKALKRVHFFNRIATALEGISANQEEGFEACKYSAARMVLYSLKCLEKLSKVEGFPAIDLSRKQSLKAVVDALDKMVKADPSREQAEAIEPKDEAKPEAAEPKDAIRAKGKPKDEPKAEAAEAKKEPQAEPKDEQKPE